MPTPTPSRKRSAASQAIVVAAPTTLNFYDALRLCFGGQRIRRLSWEKNHPLAYGEIRGNVLHIFRDNRWFTWNVSRDDVDATDWVTL